MGVHDFAHHAVAEARGEPLADDILAFERGKVFVNDVEVASAASDDPSKVAYEVTTRGTKIKSRKEWFHKPSLFFGLLDVPIPLPMTLGQIIVFIGDWIVATFGLAVIMFLSTIMTASFLPIEAYELIKERRGI